MVEMTWITKVTQMTCLTGDGRTDMEDRVDIGDMTNQAGQRQRS